MKKIIIVLILLSSPVFAYNSMPVINSVVLSSVISSNIARNNAKKEIYCELLQQCIKYKGGKACTQKYKCKSGYLK